MHNDSGDTARVFAIDRAGTTRAILSLPGVSAIDIEDIAIGPGPDEWRPYLYLGDIGVYPREQAFFPDISVEEGIRIFLTGGMSLPGRIKEVEK